VVKSFNILVTPWFSQHQNLWRTNTLIISCTSWTEAQEFGQTALWFLQNQIYRILQTYLKKSSIIKSAPQAATMHAQTAHWDVNFYTHTVNHLLWWAQTPICITQISSDLVFWGVTMNMWSICVYSHKKLSKPQYKSSTLWNPEIWNLASLNFPNQTAPQLLTWFTLYVWGGHCFTHLFSKTTSRHTRQLSGPGPMQPPRQNSWQHCPSDMQLLLPQLSGQTATSFE